MSLEILTKRQTRHETNPFFKKKNQLPVALATVDNKKKGKAGVLHYGEVLCVDRFFFSLIC